jgi:hypothetical protein
LQFTIMVEYYMDSLTGTPFATSASLQAEDGAVLTDVLTAEIGSGWINSNRPVSGYKEGAVQGTIPATLTDDLTIRVLYAPVPETPPVVTPEEPPVTPEEPPVVPEEPPVAPEEPPVAVAPEAPFVAPSPAPAPAPAPAVVRPVITPAAVASFTPAEVVQIEAQTGNPVTDLANGNVPRGDFEAAGVWSLLNLILSLICFIGFILMLVSAFRKRDVQISAKIFRIFTIVMAAVTVIVWVILDKLQMPTAWLDQYSPIILALFVVFAIAAAAFNMSKKNRDETDETDFREIA